MLGPLGKALDAVFIIGVLVNVVQLADLIPRPHPQKRHKKLV